MRASDGMRDLSNDELDRVSGAIIEIRVGPVAIQMDTNPDGGGVVIWNGRDLMTGDPNLGHEPTHVPGPRPA